MLTLDMMQFLPGKKNAYDSGNKQNVRAAASSTFNTHISIEHRFKADEQRYDAKHAPKEVQEKRYNQSKQADEEKKIEINAPDNASRTAEASNLPEPEQKEKYDSKKSVKEPTGEQIKTNEPIIMNSIEFAVLSDTFNDAVQINVYEHQEEIQETVKAEKTAEYKGAKKEETVKQVKEEYKPSITASIDIKNENYSNIKLEEIIITEASSADNNQINYSNYTELASYALYKTFQFTANAAEHRAEIEPEPGKIKQKPNEIKQEQAKYEDQKKNIQETKTEKSKENYSEKKENVHEPEKKYTSEPGRLENMAKKESAVAKTERAEPSSSKQTYSVKKSAEAATAVKESSEQSRLENITYKENRLAAPEADQKGYSPESNYMKAIIKLIKELEGYDDKYARYIRKKLEEKGYLREDLEEEKAEAKDDRKRRKSAGKQKKPKKKVKLKEKELAKRIEKILKEISRNKKKAASKTEDVIKKIITKIEKEKEVVNA